MQKQIWLFSVRNAFYKNFKAKSQRVRLQTRLHQTPFMQKYFHNLRTLVHVR